MKKRRIICIMGETASGKDTISKYIMKNFGVQPVVSFATRPMRDGEVNGREHVFITPEKMAEIRKTQDVFAYTKIEDKTKTNVDGYEYCATLQTLPEGDIIYVIDPNGVNYMKNSPAIMEKVELLVLYIYVPYEIRKERAQKSRSDFEKFETRCKQEEVQFRTMLEEKNYDYIIENLDYNQACTKVVGIVSEFLK
jgi:guanylate kinase